MFYILVTDDNGSEVHAFWSKRAAEKFCDVVNAELDLAGASGSAMRTDNRTARLMMERELRRAASEGRTGYMVSEIPTMPIDELYRWYGLYVLCED